MRVFSVGHCLLSPPNIFPLISFPFFVEVIATGCPKSLILYSLCLPLPPTLVLSNHCLLQPFPLGFLKAKSLGGLCSLNLKLTDLVSMPAVWDEEMLVCGYVNELIGDGIQPYRRSPSELVTASTWTEVDSLLLGLVVALKLLKVP
ncbi:hypothetical protein SLEP1_g43614 [Rubroshorea leprosula]|uniref:Uncharacterized protein n=1 Tax=Rubroshorea leprosula TaxID=152421 RepID=A0AAV5LDN2_9ROSI|nr:hypothetical protein SLEP1_g43614 [Rubroshorea leprosula]